MGFKDMSINMLLAGLFVFAMISFGVGLATENSANESILDDPRINSSFAELNNTLGDTQTQAEAFKNSTQQDEPSTEFNILLRSIPSTARGIIDMITSVLNVVIGLARDSLFGATFVILFTVIFAIFFITAVIYTWELVRTGRSR